MIAKMGPPSEDDMEMETAEVSFMPPNSVRPPDDAKDGREWEQMVTVKKNEDGKLSITKVGGIPLNEDMGEEPEMEETAEEEVVETGGTPESIDQAISQERSFRGV